MHILSPETDNCPSWISRRERKYFMVNLHERMLQTRRGWTCNLWSPIGRASNWATKASSRIWPSTIYYTMLCLKMLDEWQTVYTLMRCCILQHLIWVYTVCSGLSVWIHMVYTVLIFVGTVKAQIRLYNCTVRQLLTIQCWNVYHKPNTERHFLITKYILCLTK